MFIHTIVRKIPKAFLTVILLFFQIRKFLWFFVMNEQYFVQTCGMSLDSLDSEVVSLIEDLGLVLKGSVEHLAWLTALENSRYRLYPFCARYHDRQKELRENLGRLKTDLYRRNRKYSKFSYEDLSCAPLLFPSAELLPEDVSKE